MGPMELMLGGALTKDRAEAADVLRARLRASAYQLADESVTLARAQAEKNTTEWREIAAKANTKHGQKRPGVQD